MTTSAKFVVASIKPWHQRVFSAWRNQEVGDWHLIDNESAFTLDGLERLNPRYVFLMHWSAHVPDAITRRFECVCFHMTDVPYGRGGSPLQNLILRGHKETKLTALRMTSGFDEGPVYMKRDLSLEGSAQNIFERAAAMSFDMAREIALTNPKPIEQDGEPVIFRRRKPDESKLPADGKPEEIYDFIRMLDAETYPKAFLDWGDFHLQFSDAEMSGDDAVVAKVTVSRKVNKNG